MQYNFIIYNKSENSVHPFVYLYRISNFVNHQPNNLKPQFTIIIVHIYWSECFINPNKVCFCYHSMYTLIDSGTIFQVLLYGQHSILHLIHMLCVLMHNRDTKMIDIAFSLDVSASINKKLFYLVATVMTVGL